MRVVGFTVVKISGHALNLRESEGEADAITVLKLINAMCGTFSQSLDYLLMKC